MENSKEAIYKQKTTTLEYANIKLSGKYKIVIATSGALFLDDYYGNRQEINIYNDFLPQVSNFLQTQTQIIDDEILDYGLMMEDNKLKFHVPLYLSENKPEYIVVNSLLTTINFEDFTRHKTIAIQNLNILDNIFDEILSDDFKHLFYNNFGETYIELYGWSLEYNSITSLKIDTSEFQTKLTDTDDYNEYINQLFVNNNMINPRFVNIELEVDYKTTHFDPVDFYGFVGFANVAAALILGALLQMLLWFKFCAFRYHKWCCG